MDVAIVIPADYRGNELYDKTISQEGRSGGREKFSYQELAASNGQIPLSFQFTGSEGHPADYRVTGTLKVS